MSRIRTVKPSLFSSPTMARVPVAARYTCIGLFTEADDEGRFLASPKRIVGVLFPHDATVTANKVEEYLALLESVGTIWRYVVDDITYGYFPAWETHQKISHPTPSLLPSPTGGPPESLRKVSVLNREEGIGKREQGKEQGKRTARVKPSRRRAVPESFVAFYVVYPRHEKRPDAEHAYVKALEVADAEAILAGAQRYRDDPNRRDEYTMHPASWLNGRCWNDDPLPARVASASELAQRRESEAEADRKSRVAEAVAMAESTRGQP